MLFRLGTSAAALSITALAVIGLSAPAIAQEGEPGQGSERCSAAGGGPGNAPGNAPQYPPGQGPGVSDSNAERGQRMSASSGCSEFAPGQRVRYGVESVFQLLGTTVASATGTASATFTVPTNLSNGTHHVVFRGTGMTGAPNEVRIPFVVSGGPTAGAPGSGAGAGPAEGAAGGGTVNVGGVQLPSTGSDEVVPLTVLGLGLVVAGAGIVVTARRRRQDAPSTLA